MDACFANHTLTKSCAVLLATLFMCHFSIKQHFEQMCQFALLPTFARKGSYRQKSSNISIKTSQEYMKHIENGRNQYEAVFLLQRLVVFKDTQKIPKMVGTNMGLFFVY